MVHDLIINYDLHKKLDVCVRELLPFVLQALKHGLVTDYKTCDLAGNDQVPYRRVYCVSQEHRSRIARQISASNGQM